MSPLCLAAQFPHLLLCTVEPRLSGLFTQVPPSPDNQGSTVLFLNRAKQNGQVIFITIHYNHLLLNLSLVFWVSLRIRFFGRYFKSPAAHLYSE